MSTNFYDLLGIAKTDSILDIKKAYKKLALKFHPDKVEISKKKESEEFFAKISHAYEILSDEKTRRIYDTHGENGIQKSRQHHIKIQHDTIEIKCTMSELYNGCKKNIEYKKKIIDGPICGPFSLIKESNTSICIDIPSRSMPNSTLIVENEGISHFREDINGDLHVGLKLEDSHSADGSNWTYSGNRLLYNMHLKLEEWILGFEKNITHPSGNIIKIYTSAIIQLNKEKLVPFCNGADSFLINPILSHPSPLTDAQSSMLSTAFSYTPPSQMSGIDLNNVHDPSPQQDQIFSNIFFNGIPQMFSSNFFHSGHHTTHTTHTHQQCTQQ
jgi:curved DNA-binding protein CbpA